MIKYFVMDVDGTLTDGKIYIGNGGEELKAFNIKDGLGIRHILEPAGIIPVIITGRESEIVKKRAAELAITEVYQGITDKTAKLREITSDLSLVAYVGDDLNDLDCMRAVKEAGGFVGCPCDSAKEVIEIADFVSSYRGGEGAVRDIIEKLKNKLWKFEATKLH